MRHEYTSPGHAQRRVRKNINLLSIRKNDRSVTVGRFGASLNVVVCSSIPIFGFVFCHPRHHHALVGTPAWGDAQRYGTGRLVGFCTESTAVPFCVFSCPAANLRWGALPEGVRPRRTSMDLTQRQRRERKSGRTLYASST